MKHKVENSEIIIDARGLECPIPVLKARKLSQTLRNGSIVKVICTDPLAEMDFKHYCEQAKFTYLGCTKTNDIYLIKYKFFNKN